MEKITRVLGTRPDGKQVTLKKRLGPSFMNFEGTEYDNLPPVYHQYPLQVTDIRGSKDGANTIVLSQYIDKTSGITKTGLEKIRVTETIGELVDAFDQAGQAVQVRQSFGVIVRDLADQLFKRQPG